MLAKSVNPSRTLSSTLRGLYRLKTFFCQLSIDNNRAERAMRPVAIGRKNWLFVGSPKAGQRAAILMSPVASCKNSGVERWAYLKDVFTRLAGLPSEAVLAELLPDRWLKANPQHLWSIADRRKDEHSSKKKLMYLAVRLPIY